MAIYHCNCTTISRGQGRTAMAAAAYRSGEKLYDERQDKTFNYGRKQDVIYKEILLPENAPAWMSDRQKLWNAVEKAENRKDARLAREFNISLPKELSKEQNIKLAKEFMKNEFAARGMVADLCIHCDDNLSYTITTSSFSDVLLKVEECKKTLNDKIVKKIEK